MLALLALGRAALGACRARLCAANPSVRHSAVCLGKPAVIPPPDFGNFVVSLTTAGRARVFNAASVEKLLLFQGDLAK